LSNITVILQEHIDIYKHFNNVSKLIMLL